MRTLVVGVSTRAIAESAARSGERVVTVDYFGDRDQKRLVENRSLLRDLHLPFSAQALLEASGGVGFDAVVYAANLENHPEIVEQLARGRMLLGNRADVLREVRDWRTLRIPETRGCHPRDRDPPVHAPHHAAVGPTHRLHGVETPPSALHQSRFVDTIPYASLSPPGAVNNSSGSDFAGLRYNTDGVLDMTPDGCGS